MKHLFVILLLLVTLLHSQGTWQSNVQLTSHSSMQSTRIWENGRNIVTDSDNRIYTVWMDERNGTSDIYMKRYSGGTWTEIAIEQNDTSESYNPSLAVVPAHSGVNEEIWIAWVDDRSGQWEAYYRRYDVVNQTLGNRTDLSVVGGAPVVFRDGEPS